MTATQTARELVDAEGDLILEVGDPNAAPPQDTSSKENERPAKAVEQKSNANQKHGAGEQDESAEEQATDEDLDEKDKCSYLRILVCSKVLIWTSAVFRQMLNGSFAEAQQVPDAQGRRILRLPEDDPSSMLELCNILHHKAGSSDEPYPYDQMAGLAVLCDKYDFKSALYAFFGEELSAHLAGTIENLASGFPPDSHTRSAEVLRIAFVVGNKLAFSQAATIYAYVQHPDLVACDLQEAFKDTSLPEGLLRMSDFRQCGVLH